MITELNQRLGGSATQPTPVKAHYEKYVYPDLPRLASVRGCDAYALNLEALWARFNGERLDPNEGRILLAGCGSFSPYPTAVANWRTPITALDLSTANLNRARQHAWLHLHFNVDFIEGDLTRATELFSEQAFHFIDCYGVIHHIPDDAVALRTLHALLKPGAFARIMVYSRCARRSIQAARRALRLLEIQNVQEIRALCRKARSGSRFRECVDAAPEAAFDSGLADLFLHPYARTYFLIELLAKLDQADLELLGFIHPGALPDIGAEIARLRNLETARTLTTNFILFAGRKEDASRRRVWKDFKARQETWVSLNPVIKKFLPRFPLIPIKPAPRLGFDNPVINFAEKRLLARFKTPVAKSVIEPDCLEAVEKRLHALFLIETQN
ncbi:MAG: class I SAM-dependent methyltransferase [Candidatus Competibacteraceae bacterium]|nr:class I SAM-dependent methyltransferase [Candidatus Competibacteraceae bacterium]